MKMSWFRAHPRLCAGGMRVRLCALMLAMLPATAHAIANCSVTATGVAFGGYSFNNAAPTIATGNVQVSCSLIGVISLFVNYEIRLSTGNSGSYAPRKMINGGNELQYNVYTNAGNTIIWGDGNSGTSTVTDSYTLGLLTTVRNYPVYGRLPAGQNTPAGVYADTITVTVNY